MIGIVCSNIADMFYAEAVSRLEEHLNNYNYDCLLYCVKGSKEKQLSCIHILSKQVAALVFVGSVFPQPLSEKEMEMLLDTPMFFLNSVIPGDQCFCVVSNELGITSDIVCKMVEQGHHRILYIYDSLTYSGKKKMDGLKQGLSLSKIAFDPALLCKVDRNILNAQHLIECQIRSGLDFDAIIASEDLFAVAAQKALPASHCNLPIVSFNNSLLAICATPPLTSIDLMLNTMCGSLITLLVDYLKGKNIPPQIVILPTLVERESFHLVNQNQRKEAYS